MKKFIAIIFAVAFFACNDGTTEAQTPRIIVEPLIQTQWWQRAPFNNLFPIMGGNYTIVSGHVLTPDPGNGRAVTDCSNTALAQIIAFHRHPARGIGQGNIIFPIMITVPTVNFNVAYDWDNMLNTYPNASSGTERQRNAVATLMYHVATAVGTNNNSIRSLINNFGYDRSIQYHERKFYTDTEWETMIRQQLDAGLPVYCHGTDPVLPHAFIIDGYDNSGKFHINLGWGGTDDGWYSLNNINPSALGGKRSFFINQHIIINIMPDKGNVGSNEFVLKTLTASKTSVSQNELLTVTFQLIIFGFFPGGQLGVALVDSNGRIVEIIGAINSPSERVPGWQTNAEINCSVPRSVVPGQYRVMAVTRPTNGEWKIVTRSDKENNIPNSINFTVR